MGHAKYLVTEYGWNGNDYIERSKTLLKKPPYGIWLDAFPKSIEDFYGWPRIYKRHHGQINLRIVEYAHISVFLSGLKRTLPSIIKSGTLPMQLINNPIIGVRVNVELFKVFRALAKICLNFACHEYGEKIIRTVAFDEIRAFIMEGGEEIPFIEMPEKIKMILSSDKRPLHVVMLLPQIAKDGGLVALIRLYGSVVQPVRLSKNVSLPIEREASVFIVHYLENKIERLSLNAYMNYLCMQAMHLN